LSSTPPNLTALDDEPANLIVVDQISTVRAPRANKCIAKASMMDAS
jgi:hypothetical protein